MTTDTIKDVLGRIISINKNLTEESLRHLLVASGWDNADIDEGARVFRDYMGKVNLPPSEEKIDIADLKIPERESVISDTNISQSGFVPERGMHYDDTANVPVQVEVASIPHIAPVVHEEIRPVVVVTDTANHTISMSVPKPWGLIILDSILFLIALGLLIYIIVN